MYAAGVEGLTAVETGRHEQREAVDAADLDRAGGAIERAEKALNNLDAEISPPPGGLPDSARPSREIHPAVAWR